MSNYYQTSEEKDEELKNAIDDLNHKSLIYYIDYFFYLLFGGSTAGKRSFAAEKLGDIRDPRAIPHLVNSLGDWDVNVRRAVINALGDSYDPIVIPHLLNRYERENDDNTRLFIMRALDSILEIRTDTKAVLGLGDVLNNDNSVNIRKFAAKILQKMEDPKAVPYLLEAFRDSDLSVREAASFALQHCVNSSSIPILEKSLRDNNDLVRREAEKCLKIAEKRYPDL